MSAITNGTIAQVLLQQNLAGSLPETKNKQETNIQTKDVIIDIADISAVRWTNTTTDAILQSVATASVVPQQQMMVKSIDSYDLSTIVAQEIALQEKQSQIEAKSYLATVSSLSSQITQNNTTAIAQQANQSKNHTLALL
ncbi:MAG: hypothetical protein PHE78_05280 [Candidatus Gastranaerophilales bacterium]|nr:hypothetical protein [Candidatus Gastranaerophilales bacterium]